jgi:CBS domain-containing membrane protein
MQRSVNPPPNHRAEHVFLLINRLRLNWLLAHLPPTFVWAAYVALNSFVTIALLTLLALLTRSPFVFPSLGPTAYLFFFTPLAESASPRNAVLGHAIGLLCGFAAYKVTGMHAFPEGFSGEVYWPRILASALALSLTGAVMVLLHVNHPPAGATTMIVSLESSPNPDISQLSKLPSCYSQFRRSPLIGSRDCRIQSGAALHRIPEALNEHRNAHHRSGDCDARR